MKKEMSRASAHYQQSERELHQARQVSDENRLLKEEAAAMWQHLRRLEPSNPHVYGAFSNQMAHERPHQPAPAHPTPLPPIQSSSWTQGPNVMQGVEYPHSQPFDRR
jgi:hypothetical protein